jgi:hypothetical protein
MIDWDLVQDRVNDAKAIAWDTCHKIYLAMDDTEVQKLREYEYDPLITNSEMSKDEMFETLKKWFEESCPLRFIEAVSTMPEGEDPNLGFETLIGQFDSDDEECEDCGEVGCYGACYVESCERCGDRNVYEDDLCKLCYEDDEEDEEDA